MRKIVKILSLIVVMLGSLLMITGCIGINGNDPVPKITLDKESITLQVDETYKIEATVSKISEYTLAYTSTADAVATVSEDGLVKAIAVGECLITVSIIDTDVTKSLAVTVVEKIDNDEMIKILTVNNVITLLKTLKIDVDVKDNKEVLYFSGNESVATVDENGLITAHEAGKFILRIQLKENDNVYIEKEYTVKTDPLYLMSLLNVEKPLVQYVTSYGYNPDTRQQWVYGSVSRYFNTPLVIIESFAKIDDNPYVGQKANQAMLMPLDKTGLVRTGILLEELKYITYHDTGNHTPGAKAYNNLEYMKGTDNRNATARSWHYTVDDTTIYYGVPDNEVTWQGDSYYAYAQSIGIETCVDFGSDLYATWQRAAKLIASLLIKYDLGIEDIKQHYDWNKKECPQTLRKSGLYPEAMALVEAEYLVLKHLSEYQISFKSLDERYVDNRGKVINLPQVPTRVGYIVTIKGEGGYEESQLFYSVLTPTTGGDVSQEPSDIMMANDFDERVLAIGEKVTLNDAATIISLVEEYKSFSNNIKNLVVTYELLEDKLADLQMLKRVDTPIMIYEVFGNTQENSYLKYGYIMLYNPTDVDVSLSGKFLLTYVNGFGIDANNEGIKWYQFKDTDVIKAGGYYLIQGAISLNGANLGYSALPDVVTNLLIDSENGVVALTDDLVMPTTYLDEHLIDLVGYGNVSVYEESEVMASCDQALRRKMLLDTNNNYWDFITGEPDPFNSYLTKKEGILLGSAMRVREVDLFIKLLAGMTLTIDDQVLYEQLVSAYQALTFEEVGMLSCQALYEAICYEMEGLINPEFIKINEALSKMPKQIITDQRLPEVEGVVYRYKAGEDTSYYNLETGQYLKLSHQSAYVTLIASYNGVEKEFIINFGILESNQQTVYITGDTSATVNTTYLGSGTYQNQLATAGFGGVVMIVNNKVYFMGKNAYIKLTKPAGTSILDINSLRPHGVIDANFYNIGMSVGTPVKQFGTGVLYENTASVALTFDPSFTYGRNNAAAYGYNKVILRPNAQGTYTLIETVGDTGTNETTQNKSITLLPGDFLWCPHYFEAGTNFGTFLIYRGSSTSSNAVLSLNCEVTIKTYKQF